MARVVCGFVWGAFTGGGGNGGCSMTMNGTREYWPIWLLFPYTQTVGQMSMFQIR